MSRPLKFIVEGPPKGKGRPRMNRQTGRVTTPKDTKKYEYAVKVAAQQALAHRRMTKLPAWDLEGAYKLKLIVYTRDFSRPDGSNVLKAVEDAMNEVVYEDDRQIVIGYFELREDPERPRCEVEVTRLMTAEERAEQKKAAAKYRKKLRAGGIPMARRVK